MRLALLLVALCAGAPCLFAQHPLEEMVKREKTKPTSAETVRDRFDALRRAALDGGSPERILPRKKALEIAALLKDGMNEEAAGKVHELILALEGVSLPKPQIVPLANPTSGAKLWAAVYAPAGANETKRCPAVVIVPGGLGFGSSAARGPELDAFLEAGCAVGYFDPDGRGKSEGEENWNGKVHQDGLHEFLNAVAALEFVDRENIGVVSSSLGLALAAGALGRYPGAPPVKYFIDIEGPSDRFYITKSDDPRFLEIFDGHTTKEEEWWAEREAVRSIQKVTCAYLRIQHERDHVHGENKQHALDMINAATSAEGGGKGKSPWTRINGPENKANRTYGKGETPQWLPNRQGPPGGDEILGWVKELSARR